MTRPTYRTYNDPPVAGAVQTGTYTPHPAGVDAVRWELRGEPSRVFEIRHRTTGAVLFGPVTGTTDPYCENQTPAAEWWANVRARADAIADALSLWSTTVPPAHTFAELEETTQ